MRLSSQKYDRLHSIGMELVELSKETHAARPELSRLLHSFGMAIARSGAPNQKAVIIELPNKIDAARVGSSIMFYLNNE